MSSLLVLDRITRTVSSGKTLVDSVSFEFNANSIYSILGPSGAGKTSLLRLINRLDEPTSGTIEFEGQDFTRLPVCELRREIGYLFQVAHMFEGTVADNIREGRSDLTDDEIAKLLQSVTLEPSLAEQEAESVSVGQKQRVALARMLATDPKVILLDEPTAALDPTYTRLLEQSLVKIVEERGLTAIVVSHNPEQAVRLGGTGLLLVEGKLIESGSVKDIVENPSTEMGQRYQRRELT